MAISHCKLFTAQSHYMVFLCAHALSPIKAGFLRLLIACSPFSFSARYQAAPPLLPDLLRGTVATANGPAVPRFDTNYSGGGGGEYSLSCHMPSAAGCRGFALTSKAADATATATSSSPPEAAAESTDSVVDSVPPFPSHAAAAEAASRSGRDDAWLWDVAAGDEAADGPLDLLLLLLRGLERPAVAGGGIGGFGSSRGSSGSSGRGSGEVDRHLPQAAWRPAASLNLTLPPHPSAIAVPDRGRGCEVGLESPPARFPAARGSNDVAVRWQPLSAEDAESIAGADGPSGGVDGRRPAAAGVARDCEAAALSSAFTPRTAASARRLLALRLRSRAGGRTESPPWDDANRLQGQVWRAVEKCVRGVSRGAVCAREACRPRLRGPTSRCGGHRAVSSPACVSSPLRARALRVGRCAGRRSFLQSESYHTTTGRRCQFRFGGMAVLICVFAGLSHTLLCCGSAMVGAGDADSWTLHCDGSGRRTRRWPPCL